MQTVCVELTKASVLPSVVFDCAMDLPDINLPLLNNVVMGLCDVLCHCVEGFAGSTVL